MLYLCFKEESQDNLMTITFIPKELLLSEDEIFICKLDKKMAEQDHICGLITEDVLQNLIIYLTDILQSRRIKKEWDKNEEETRRVC